MNYTTNHMTITASDDVIDDMMKTCFRTTPCDDGLARAPSCRLDFEAIRPIGPGLAFVAGMTRDRRMAFLGNMLAAEPALLEWDDTARIKLEDYKCGLSNDLRDVFTYLRWGAVEPGFDFMLVRLENALIIRFTNLGNPPLGIFSKLGEKYSTASIRILAADHPESFRGEISVVDGELLATRWAMDDRNAK